MLFAQFLHFVLKTTAIVVADINETNPHPFGGLFRPITNCEDAVGFHSRPSTQIRGYGFTSIPVTRRKDACRERWRYPHSPRAIRGIVLFFLPADLRSAIFPPHKTRA